MRGDLREPVCICRATTAQVVGLTGIGSGAPDEVQTLTITATSSNPSLIPDPSVTYTSPNATATLTLTPNTNTSGTATISVTVRDGQPLNNSVTRSFTVTVAPGNQAPTIAAISDLSINEDAALQTVPLTGLGPGATNEAQSLAISATSSNPALIPNPAVSYANPNTSGTLTFTPAPNGYGSATITVTVDDGQILVLYDVLDITTGRPLSGLQIELYDVATEPPTLLNKARTNPDGRTDAPILPAASARKDLASEDMT